MSTTSKVGAALAAIALLLTGCGLSDGQQRSSADREHNLVVENRGDRTLAVVVSRGDWDEMFDLEMGRVPPFSEGYFLIASGHLHVYTRTRGQEFYRDRGHFWFSQHQDHPHVVVVNTF